MEAMHLENIPLMLSGSVGQLKSGSSEELERMNSILSPNIDWSDSSDESNGKPIGGNSSHSGIGKSKLIEKMKG